MNNNKPIGIFDSGVGGLTVLKSIKKILPNEKLIYFGDTARNPYGPRSKSTIEKYSEDICNFLMEFDVKYIVIACNTASSLAIDYLQKQFSDTPIMGVIAPGVQAAIKSTKNDKIGVIGTVGTIQSGAYVKRLKKINNNIVSFSQSCPLFVPIIEEAWMEHKITPMVIEEYLVDIKNSDIDTLILGCTHYPIIKKQIQNFVGDNINLVDSADTTAISLKDELKILGLLNSNSSIGTLRFYVSNEPERFKRIGEHLFKNEINNVQLVVW